MQEIIIRKIEESIEYISLQLNNVSEDEIDCTWVNSDEILQIFKYLIEKIELENDSEKIIILSEIFFKFTKKNYSKEQNKLF